MNPGNTGKSFKGYFTDYTGSYNNIGKNYPVNYFIFDSIRYA